MLKPFMYFLLGIALVSIPCFSYADDLCGDGSDHTVTSITNRVFVNLNYFATCESYDNYTITGDGTAIHDYNGSIVSSSGLKCQVTRDFIVFVCSASDPSTCSNGYLDEGETGIDCGGSCSSECVNYCPDGTKPVPTYNGGQIVSYGCANIQDNKNSFGSCPSGWFPSSDGNGCVESLTVLLVQPSASQEYIDSFTDPTVEGSSGVTTGTFSQTEFYTPETVVDNGDGTETAKLTKITTGSDGSSTSSTTTVIRPSGSSSGTGFTADGTPSAGYEGTTETDEEKPGEATIGSTERAELPDISDAITSGIDQSFATFNDFIDDVKNSELSDVFTNIMTPPADSSGSDVLFVDMGSYGSQTIDFTSSQGLYDILGGVLQTCAFITGAYIVFRKQ